MAQRQVHERGALIRFTHWDARRDRKPGRPGVVADAKTGNLVIYYGSTFKKGGYPKDAIEISPVAEPGSQARELAEELPGFVDEPTFFHGSLLAEAPIRGEVDHIPAYGFPNDLLDDLEEQAEERLVGFLRAWETLRWLTQRAGILQALWGTAKLDLKAKTLLSLVLCDGWTSRAGGSSVVTRTSTRRLRDGERRASILAAPHRRIVEATPARGERRQRLVHNDARCGGAEVSRRMERACGSAPEAGRPGTSPLGPGARACRPIALTWESSPCCSSLERAQDACS